MLRSKSTKSIRTRKATAKSKVSSLSLFARICRGIVLAYLAFIIGYAIGTVLKAIWNAFKARKTASKAKRARRARKSSKTTTANRNTSACMSMIHIPSFTTDSTTPLTFAQERARDIAAEAEKVAESTIASAPSSPLQAFCDKLQKLSESEEAVAVDLAEEAKWEWSEVPEVGDLDFSENLIH